jgi:hypothetical protein
MLSNAVKGFEYGRFSKVQDRYEHNDLYNPDGTTEEQTCQEVFKEV